MKRDPCKPNTPAVARYAVSYIDRFYEKTAVLLCTTPPFPLFFNRKLYVVRTEGRYDDERGKRCLQEKRDKGWAAGSRKRKRERIQALKNGGESEDSLSRLMSVFVVNCCRH